MIRECKSPSTLVLRHLSTGGLQLTKISSPNTLDLNANDAILWAAWDTGNPAWPILTKRLRAAGFLEDREVSPFAKSPRDGIILHSSQHHCHSYTESPDLCILFNTALMANNNPLLALAPYGSLCWKGLMAGWSIGQIRSEAWRIFGEDVVLLFLEWLHTLGFLEPHQDLSNCVKQPPNFTCEFRAPDVQFRLAHAIQPWYCLWEINTICDLRCRLCYLPHYNSNGPDQRQTEYILQQILDAGLFYVVLLGGEALLRSDLEILVRRLRDAGVFVKLITNGMQLTPRRAAKLAEVGLNQIEVSFDGLCAITHEASRGEGTFHRACSAIEIARAAAIPRCGIVWTIHNQNLAEFVNLPEFMSCLNINECYVSIFRKSGMIGTSAPFVPINVYELQLIAEQAHKWMSTYPQFTIAIPTACSCGRTSLVIGYNGDLRVCPSHYEQIGNLYDSSLTSLWQEQESHLSIATNEPLGFCAKHPSPLNHL